jgi:hypothetical protein
MIPQHLLEMELPDGNMPHLPEVTVTPEVNDAWHLENLRLRRERGDFKRSETPVNVPFEMK